MFGGRWQASWRTSQHTDKCQSSPHCHAIYFISWCLLFPPVVRTLRMLVLQSPSGESLSLLWSLLSAVLGLGLSLLYLLHHCDLIFSSASRGFSKALVC
jgi:hypothetical protein